MREKIEKQMDEYMEKYLSLYPFSGSIAAIYKGEVVFNKAYGLASIEHDVPNTPQTKHKIWSVTKQFTAAAILMLEERGLLKVEDSLKKYFSDCTTLDERITIHHLLTNTSGLFNYSNLENSHEIFYRTTHKTEDLLKQFTQTPLDFEPGTQYSNTGYWFLGQLIERISGISYAQYILDNIFSPLKMYNTGVDTDLAIVKDLATGYYLNRSDFIRCGYVDMSLISSSGGIYSTAEDLLKWHMALMSDKILSQKSISRMNTNYMDDYGYGVEVYNVDGKSIITHDGGCEGFLANLVRRPDNDFAAAAISNYGFANVWGLCRIIRDITLGKEYEMPAKPPAHSINGDLLDEYIGKYEDGNELKQAGDELHFILDSKFILPVYPISDEALHHTWIDESYGLDRNDDGIPTLWGSKKLDMAQASLDVSKNNNAI